MKVILLVMAFSAGMASAQMAAPLPGTGNVALPLDEYNRLVELAGRPAKKTDAPPLPWVLQRAELKLQVTGESASGTVQLDGEVLATGSVKVPLLAGMTVFDARRQGNPLPLLLEAGSHVAVLNGPADFSVTLEAGLPVAIEAGRASVTIPAPGAGTVRLSLAIPGDHTSVNLTGGLITARASSGGKTAIEATLTGGQPATVWWATREAAAPAIVKEARYLADVKSLITVGEAEIAMAALAEITVVQGEPAQFEATIPAGWEVTGATGATLESSEMQGGALVLKVSGAARSHAFLITMERAASGAKAEIAAVGFAGAQRETGEIVVEGEGTMELAAKESGGVKRMDVKEASPYLRSMAHQSVQAAFRYHRQPGETPGLALDWTRFPDTNLLAAVAQSATVTTLVTSEGRSLTEVKLSVRNREQPFLKLALPAGASVVSAEVAGQPVKPVQGADGSRVPLLRAGFRPDGAYDVSFVMMHSGAPFANKGGGELALPKMDVPIGLVEWEVYLPERYRVRDFGGDVVAAGLLQGISSDAAPVSRITADWALTLGPGTIGGFVVDPSGGAMPGVDVTVTHVASGAVEHARTDQRGHWAMLMRSGLVSVKADASGFRRHVQQAVNSPQGTRVDIRLDVGAVTETVEVAAMSSGVVATDTRQEKPINQAQTVMSRNVTDLQRRVAGVLPIRVDVPKAGNSYRFVRPLVLDEETKVTFRYRAR